MLPHRPPDTNRLARPFAFIELDKLPRETEPPPALDLLALADWKSS
jgi:hypothetical protein